MPFTEAGLAGVQTERDGGGSATPGGLARRRASRGGGTTGLLTWSPQAYLNMRTDPTPTTKGSAKATGRDMGVVGSPARKDPHLSHLETGRGRKCWTPKNLMEALMRSRQAPNRQSWQALGLILLPFTKQPVHPHQFPAQPVLHVAQASPRPQPKAPTQGRLQGQEV